MKRNDINELDRLNVFSYENYFNVYSDSNGQYFYNLLKNINIFPSSDSEAEISYTTTESDNWYNMSFKFYGNMNLWWVIFLYNQLENPVIMPEPGTTLKILKPDYVSLVLQELDKQNT
jgi:nucleoid-associated protein YgaU